MDKILKRKTPHGQNVTGCANKMNRPRTKRHTDKMPYGQDHMPYGQDHTTYHGQNVRTLSQGTTQERKSALWILTEEADLDKTTQQKVPYRQNDMGQTVTFFIQGVLIFVYTFKMQKIVCFPNPFRRSVSDR